MDWYIGLHLQWDPHPFLFGSPARYVASCSLLLCNRLTSDPLPVAESARPRPPLRPQLPLQLPGITSFLPGTISLLLFHCCQGIFHYWYFIISRKYFIL